MRCPKCGSHTEWQRDGIEEGWQVMRATCTSCAWEDGDAAPCIDPDCGQTTGHAEDCELNFGDAFAQREKGQEA